MTLCVIPYPFNTQITQTDWEKVNVFENKNANRQTSAPRELRLNNVIGSEVFPSSIIIFPSLSSIFIPIWEQGLQR